MSIKGEIQNFTGISAPYEEPLEPEIIVETDKEMPMESAQKVIQQPESMEYIPLASESVIYTAEEEERIKEKLKASGYL